MTIGAPDVGGESRGNWLDKETLDILKRAMGELPPEELSELAKNFEKGKTYPDAIRAEAIRLGIINK